MSQSHPKYVECHPRNTVINSSEEFRKKQLCTHTLDIGLLCDHGCSYCSTPSIEAARTNSIFKERKTTAQKEHRKHIAYVDLATPEKVKSEAKKLTKDDTVMFCAKVDPFSPHVQELNIFQDSLRNLLEANDECRVRILSKNAGIVDVLDEFVPYQDRISFSLSITAPRSKAEFSTIVEPNASSIADRLEALRKAKEMGFTVYGMICPCSPSILTSQEDLESVFDEIMLFEPEAIWVEPVNARGAGLKDTAKILEDAGEKEWAKAISSVSKEAEHDQYVAGLIETVNATVKKKGVDVPVHMLIYNQIVRLVKDDRHVIWLSKFKTDKLYKIHIDELQANPDQPRTHFDETRMDELISSVEEHGVFQPILFSQDERNRPFVVAGERRLRALRSLRDQSSGKSNAKKVETIPALFVSENADEIALIENIQRDDLTPVELAKSLGMLQKTRKCTHDVLSQMVGLKRSTVTEILSINKLPPEILAEAEANKNISRWMLVEVAKCSTKKAQINKWEKLKNSGITQGEYKKRKAAVPNKKESKNFDLKTGRRFIKTATAQIQKLDDEQVKKLSSENRKKLRDELEMLRKEVEQSIHRLRPMPTQPEPPVPFSE